MRERRWPRTPWLTLLFCWLFHQDINSLNKQIAQLQDFVRAKGSQSGRHLQTHSNTIVVSLQVGPGGGSRGDDRQEGLVFVC